jgi:RNA polymerase primary sigma factor
MALADRAGRQPTNEELGAEMGLPADNVPAIQRAIGNDAGVDDVPGEESEADVDSLGRPSRSGAPMRSFSSKTSWRNSENCSTAWTNGNRRILKLRYGLSGREPMTLKEIGAEVGLTRERVRQIEVESIRRLNQILNRG